ncbi:hypothetical protein OSTOST_04820 [Ostertagia ostertagi]
MYFVLFRATAFATLLLLAKVTPALLCTFKQLPPSAIIKAPTVLSTSSSVKNNTGDCMRMCYEDPSCVYVIAYKNGICSFNPNKGNTMRVDAVFAGKSVGGDVFQLDRDTTDMKCPKLGEWLEENR